MRFSFTYLEFPERKLAGHRIVLAAFSKFLHKKFLQDPNPAAVILIENVEDRFLGYFFKMVYEGKVVINREEVEGFKQALRSLNVNVQGDRDLRRFIYEDDDEEEPSSSVSLSLLNG